MDVVVITQNHHKEVAIRLRKIGHLALNYWHRLNTNYNSSSQSSSNPTSLLTSTDTNSIEWYIDFSSTNHLTRNIYHLQNVVQYQGSKQIQVGNGMPLLISYTGQGILPTPNCKLLLSKLFHALKLSHNLIYVPNLITDNNCIISFDSFGYRILHKGSQD